MDTNTALAFIIVGVVFAGAAIHLGYKERYASHQFNIRRDIKFVFLIIGEVFTIFFTAFFLEWDMWSSMILLIIIFDIFFIQGYRIADPYDYRYFHLYDEDLETSFLGPIVFFRDRNGQQCIMHDTLKSSFKALMGVSDPLELDLSKVRRTRTECVKVGRKKKWIEVIAAWNRGEVDLNPVGKLRIGSRKIKYDDGRQPPVERVPRYMFYFSRKYHVIEPADSVTGDPRTFELRTDVYVDSVKKAVVWEEKALRYEVQLTSAKYDAGAEIVEGVIDKSIDMGDTRKTLLQQIKDTKEKRAREEAARIESNKKEAGK